MTSHIVQMLIAEREKLNRAIEALGAEPKRRGRPPGSGRKGPGRPPGRRPGRPKKRGGGGMSAEARRAQSERMKAYWAARRKQKGKG